MVYTAVSYKERVVKKNDCRLLKTDSRLGNLLCIPISAFAVKGLA